MRVASWRSFTRRGKDRKRARACCQKYCSSQQLQDVLSLAFSRVHRSRLFRAIGNLCPRHAVCHWLLRQKHKSEDSLARCGARVHCALSPRSILFRPSFHPSHCVQKCTKVYKVYKSVQKYAIGCGYLYTDSLSLSLAMRTLQPAHKVFYLRARVAFSRLRIAVCTAPELQLLSLSEASLSDGACACETPRRDTTAASPGREAQKRPTAELPSTAAPRRMSHFLGRYWVSLASWRIVRDFRKLNSSSLNFFFHFPSPITFREKTKMQTLLSPSISLALLSANLT